MARSRKRVKRKSDVRNLECSQPVTPRKQCRRQKPEPEQTWSQRRRGGTWRYNLRESNSVIMVGEVPCCQTSEQQEKYTKLGLNTALFLKGSQPPKRKQSHISVISISSDDEETSEERTSEWVNSLDGTIPSSMNGGGNPEKKQKMFHPLCSSTPRTSQHQINEPKKTEDSTVIITSTELSTGASQDMVNDNQEVGKSNSTSSEDPRGQTPIDEVEQAETFQVVISISDTAKVQSSTQFPVEELTKDERCDSLNSEECIMDQVEQINEADDDSCEMPPERFKLNFTLGRDERMDQDSGIVSENFCQDSMSFSTYDKVGDGCKPTSGQDVEFKLPGNPVVKITEANGSNYKTFQQDSGSSFSFASGFSSTSPSWMFKSPLNGKTSSTNRFYFGSASDGRSAAANGGLPNQSYFNNPMNTSTCWPNFNLGSTNSNERQDDTNKFCDPDEKSLKSKNNERDSNSLNSDDSDALLDPQ